MQINPRLAALLENDDCERLQALLLWFSADSQRVQTHASRLSGILDETRQLPDRARRLWVEDMVELSILNEFGPEFRCKPFFGWLNRETARRLTAF